MSAYEVTDRVLKELDTNKYDVMILNFANCDMVGHTGIFDAAVSAVKAVDECVKKVVDKIFYQNLLDMLGEPNAIDYDYFIKKCDELLAKADPESLNRYNLWCMKNDFITMKEKGELTYYKMLNR
jgi:hypothetical protein